jgi:hypothetical protein
MSTRGTFGVRIDGNDKLMYNHSDSYPEGLGVEMLETTRQLLKENGKDWLKEKAKALRMVNTNTEVPTEEDIERLKPYTDLHVSERSTKDWYCLMRNMQGDLKTLLEVGIGSDGAGFIRNSLFCEWGYIVNLDDNKLEVYKGFQRKPHDKGRYGRIEPTNDYRTSSGNVYCPCALYAEFDLDNLPTRQEFKQKMEELYREYEKAEYAETGED